MPEKPLSELIDTTLERIEKSELTPVEFAQQLLGDQPVIIDYFFTGDYEILSEDEADYSFFLGSIIVESVRLWKGLPGKLTEDEIGEIEEKFWSRLETAQKNRIPNPLEEILANYIPDDVADFILDAIDEEIDFLTEPGREFILVKMATLAKALT